MKSHLPLALVLGAASLLGGCKKEASDQPKAAAGGELLDRSVSDDMLPYDTVKSQATLTDPGAGLGDTGPVRPQAAASEAAEDGAAVTAPEDTGLVAPAAPAVPAQP